MLIMLEVLPKLVSAMSDDALFMIDKPMVHKPLSSNRIVYLKANVAWHAL